MLKLATRFYCRPLLTQMRYNFNTIKEDLSDERISYEMGSLDESTVSDNPFLEFDKWYHQAHNTKEIREANAMILCTSTKSGLPSGRPVLLKAFDEGGFVFYTNYRSRKSHDIGENPNASLVFYWDFLEKVVRIEGVVKKLDEAQSTEYFQSRPKESQIGAWASPVQSQVVKDRHEIEAKAKEYSDKFKGVDKVPKPDFWGGWVVIPSYFEFWQGRKSRLHDRICFEREDLNTKNWTKHRLSP